MKSSFETFLTTASSKQWTIKTTNIKSVFLQDAPVSRDVFIQPLAKSATPPGMIWKLRCFLYGLNDAARQFYESAHTTLFKLDCSQSSINPALYYNIRKNETHGLFVCHVDDLLHAGTETFELDIYDNLIIHFKPGKLDHSNFKYIGFNVNQIKTSTTIDQLDYIKNIAISTSPILHHVNSNRELSDSKITLFHSIFGCLNWAVKGSRPDAAFNMTDFNTKMKNACKKDYVQVQKVIQYLQNNPLSIRYPKLCQSELWSIVVFTDASYASTANKYYFSARHNEQKNKKTIGQIKFSVVTIKQ